MIEPTYVFVVIEKSGTHEDYFEDIKRICSSEQAAEQYKTECESHLRLMIETQADLTSELGRWAIDGPPWHDRHAWCTARVAHQTAWLEARQLTSEMLSIDPDTTYEVRIHELF